MLIRAIQIIIIIGDFRRPNGEALENFPPAEGRPVGGVRGGGSPPATTIHYYNRKGEALENSPPAEGRPVGGVRGGGAPCP